MLRSFALKVRKCGVLIIAQLKHFYSTSYKMALIGLKKFANQFIKK